MFYINSLRNQQTNYYITRVVIFTCKDTEKNCFCFYSLQDLGGNAMEIDKKFDSHPVCNFCNFPKIFFRVYLYI